MPVFFFFFKFLDTINCNVIVAIPDIMNSFILLEMKIFLVKFHLGDINDVGVRFWRVYIKETCITTNTFDCIMVLTTNYFNVLSPRSLLTAGGQQDLAQASKLERIVIVANGILPASWKLPTEISVVALINISHFPILESWLVKQVGISFPLLCSARLIICTRTLTEILLAITYLL